jgi:hypothetical protein
MAAVEVAETPPAWCHQWDAFEVPEQSRSAATRDVVVFALRALGQTTAQTYELDERRPDDVVRDRPAIDFTATGGGRRVGIEHTLIEPYEGYFVDVLKAEERLGDVRRRLEGLLAAGSVYDLTFGPGAVAARRSAESDEIAAWVLEVAPTLPEGGPGRSGHWAASPPGRFRADLVLYRWPRTHPGPQLRYRVGLRDDTMRLRPPTIIGVHTGELGLPDRHSLAK